MSSAARQRAALETRWARAQRLAREYQLTVRRQLREAEGTGEGTTVWLDPPGERWPWAPRRDDWMIASYVAAWLEGPECGFAVRWDRRDPLRIDVSWMGESPPAGRAPPPRPPTRTPPRAAIAPAPPPAPGAAAVARPAVLSDVDAILRKKRG